MERRDFMKGLLAGLSSIPFVGHLIPTEAAEVMETAEISKLAVNVPKTTFDSMELNRLVVKHFNTPSKNGKQLFLSRTPVIDVDDDEVVGKFKGQFVAADIITDEQEAIVYDTVGRFEFISTNIPNLKIGSRVGQSIIHQEGRLQMAALENKPIKENDVKFINDWRETTAESLAVGLKQRMNSLIAGIMLGGYEYNGIILRIETPDWVHVKHDRETLKESVLAQVKFMKDTYSTDLNRITMGTPMFRKLSEEMAGGEKDVEKAKIKIEKELKLFVEIYDEVIFVQGHVGQRLRERVLPRSKILFSNTSYDNNYKAIYFGNAVVTESIISRSLGNPISDGVKHGAIAYFSGNRELNPPEIRAWAVNRGIPVLANETAFSSLTVDGMEKAE